ncbi:uncharacterized protein EI90DRAFT_3287199 [Cantharellus anzutake]|uniref:uncharacterized protein n=1 Tax=Cantharellus anzutake TaxID=1750568 RepID=UPI0019041C37|nr:uncharacterized protein EI90DRAFT_3287199 [Cantharellus anzutake]KAF8336819.1 hypothetical protein EI90DRAFT_3287199 [Cantharellus anzutake]
MSTVPRATPSWLSSVPTAGKVTNDMQQEHRVNPSDPRDGTQTLETQVSNNLFPDVNSGEFITEKCRTCTERKKRCPLGYDEHGRCQECARLSLDCVQNSHWEVMSYQARIDFNLERRRAAKSARKARYNAPKARRALSRMQSSRETSLSFRRRLRTPTRVNPPPRNQPTSELITTMSGEHSNIVDTLLSLSSQAASSDAPPQEMNLPTLPQSFGLPLGSSSSTYNQPLRTQDSSTHLDLHVSREPAGLHGSISWDVFDWKECPIPGDDILSTHPFPAARPRSPFTAGDLQQPPQHWGLESKLPSHPSPTSYHTQEYVPNHLSVAQGPGPPLSASAHPNNIRHNLSPQTCLNPFQPVAHFKDYITTLFPNTSRIVIEVENDRGPELVDLSALLDYINNPRLIQTNERPQYLPLSSSLTRLESFDSEAT